MMRHIIPRIFLSLTVAAAAMCGLPLSAQNEIPGAELIQEAELLQTVTYLASPELQGRRPGSEGYYQAAEYNARRFAEAGLEPLGENGFFQNLSVEYADITTDPEFMLLKEREVVRTYDPGSDFVCRGMTGFGDVTGEVVFCGYGISEPQLGYDDYSEADVKGKIVMVFKQNPGWTIKGFDASDKYNRYRANIAAKHGAAALILVSAPLSKNPQKPIGSIMDGSGKYDESFPQIHVDIAVADELLEHSGAPSLRQLQKNIDSLQRPSPLQLATSVRIHVQGEYHPEKNTMNVVALLRGSDPLLAEEYVVVGAHLDHVGRQGDRLYFPGANDNASGSAAVLAIAEAFAKADVRPKRSLLFVLFTSEEQGLLGSQHFVDHSPVPHESIVAAINLDCIAVGDSIQIGAGKSNPKLWDMAWKQDSATSKRMVRSTWLGGGADLEAFYKARIPGLYFVTRDSYTHLHLPSDLPETLNIGLFGQITRLAYSVAFKVAMGNYRREEVEQR